MSSSANGLRLTSLGSSSSTDEFVQFTASMRLPIPPAWGSKGEDGGDKGSGGMDGVREVLAGWVMRYLPPLGAVLLTFDPVPVFGHPPAQFSAAHSPFPLPADGLLTAGPSASQDSDDELAGQKVLLKTLPMIEGSGFTLATVNWRGTGWRPRVGQKIVGSPTLSTPSHVSLLLHNLFNASIPASHIPTDTWHFDPDFPVPEAVQSRQQWALPSVGSASNQAAAEAEQEAQEGEGEGEGEEAEEGAAEAEEVDVEEDEDAQFRERGWWRHNETNEPLGGADGRIEFTIVSLTIANSMISITGSLLADPFAPNLPSVPAPTTKQLKKKRSRAHSDASSSSSRSASPEPLAAPPSIGRATPAPADESSSESDASSESSSEEERKPAKKVKKEK